MSQPILTDNLALGQFGTAELQSYIAMSIKKFGKKWKGQKVTRIQSYRVTGPSFFGEKKTELQRSEETKLQSCRTGILCI